MNETYLYGDKVWRCQNRAGEPQLDALAEGAVHQL